MTGASAPDTAIRKTTMMPIDEDELRADWKALSARLRAAVTHTLDNEPNGRWRSAALGAEALSAGLIEPSEGSAHRLSSRGRELAKYGKSARPTTNYSRLREAASALADCEVVHQTPDAVRVRFANSGRSCWLPNDVAALFSDLRSALADTPGTETGQ